MSAPRRSSIWLTAFTVLLAAALLSPRAASEEYALPAAWAGTKDGSADGNPALVDGVPRWRLDAVVNPGQKADQGQRPDPLEPSHYMPLFWMKDRWKVDLPQYQSVEFKDGSLIMGRAMARVVAHELYHMLTGSTAHARSGIARAEYSRDDLTADEFLFCEKEVGWVRRWAQARRSN